MPELGGPVDVIGCLVRRETGIEEWMKEPYVEGVATHDGPESCVVVRKGGGEAALARIETAKAPNFAYGSAQRPVSYITHRYLE